MYDYLIHNVSIVDGTGAEPFAGDVAIKGGRIVALGALEGAGQRFIDGSGLVAAPGFIDMHSHTDLAYLNKQPPEAKIRQGITTELLAQDGLGVAPVSDDNVELLSELTAGLLGPLPGEYWTWRSFEAYLQALERRGLPNNAAVLASHGPVRIMALGMDDRPARPDELGHMRALVREALDNGAFGLSTGLIYPPCSYGPTDELVALNQEVAAHDGLFVVHQRDEGYRIERAFEEVTLVARRSRVRLHVSHLQAYGQANWPKIDAVLERADAFLREGGVVTWDRYPYLAGCTVLSAVLPPWTFAEGTRALVGNLMRPEFRARIRQDFAKGLEVWNNRSVSVGWRNIVVSAVNSEKNRWMEGRDCADLARTCGKDAIDLVCDLLAEENLAVTMISFYGSEQVLEKVLTHPQATVGSDGIFGGRPHPRLYGAFPRFLKEFVRQRRLLSLPQAIRQTTAFPAQILGLTDRGLLRPGFWADMVLFDPDAIGDTATYEEPMQYPTGLPYVFVNGELAVDGGVFTGNLAGKVLRKQNR
ncbi:MAG: N-acyl-D-amino-acid deacylase family protein [Chloroflexota bacterium]